MVYKGCCCCCCCLFYFHFWVRHYEIWSIFPCCRRHGIEFRSNNISFFRRRSLNLIIIVIYRYYIRKGNNEITTLNPIIIDSIYDLPDIFFCSVSCMDPRTHGPIDGLLKPNGKFHVNHHPSETIQQTAITIRCSVFNRYIPNIPNEIYTRCLIDIKCLFCRPLCATENSNWQNATMFEKR